LILLSFVPVRLCLLRFDEVVSGAKLVRYGMAMQRARYAADAENSGSPRNA
jgi:hypothetical protein